MCSAYTCHTSSTIRTMCCSSAGCSPQSAPSGGGDACVNACLYRSAPTAQHRQVPAVRMHDCRPRQLEVPGAQLGELSKGITICMLSGALPSLAFIPLCLHGSSSCRRAQPSALFVSCQTFALFSCCNASCQLQMLHQQLFQITLLDRPGYAHAVLPQQLLQLLHSEASSRCCGCRQWQVSAAAAVVGAVSWDW